MRGSIRIPTMVGLLIVVAGLVAAVIISRQPQTSPRAALSSPIPTNVAISNVTDQAFTVSWTTATATVGFIEISKSLDADIRRYPDDRDAQSDTAASTTVHYVTVRHLEPKTKYLFKLGAGTEDIFDQGGSPFSVTTAPALSGLPSPDSASGTIMRLASVPAGGVIVFIQIPTAQLLSTLTTTNGNWLIPLSGARREDLLSWATYNPAATVYTIRVEGADAGTASALLTTAQDHPSPPIFLGQSHDFRPPIESDPTTAPPPSSTSELSPAPTEPINQSDESVFSMFNFYSLGPVTPVEKVVTIDNPASDGEVIGADKPELFGQGPSGTQVEIKVESPSLINGNTLISSSGRWSFTVPSSLAPGKHTVTVSWIDTSGIRRRISREFIVNASSDNPSFTATASATPGLQLSVTPTSVTSPTPTARPAAIPTAIPTIPQSGSLTPGLSLFMIGLILTGGGIFLLRQW